MWCSLSCTHQLIIEGRERATSPSDQSWVTSLSWKMLSLSFMILQKKRTTNAAKYTK